MDARWVLPPAGRRLVAGPLPARIIRRCRPASFGFSEESVIRPARLTFMTPNSGAWPALDGRDGDADLGARSRWDSTKFR